MKVVMAGASGLVGGALTPALRNAGHDVFRLVRGRDARAPDEIAWDPNSGEIDRLGLEGAGAIINLAGENISAGRWTVARRERILRSRVDSTRTLVSAIAELERKPMTFLSASAVGFYGDRGDEVLTETSGIGHGYLPEVCLAWETHADGAARAGVRTVLMRFGIVLTREGGALAKMLPLFRWGLGGRLGSGRQWMSWIALDDVVGAILHALNDSRCAGPINFVAPAAVTNREFTATLARVLRRPAIFPVPAWALRMVVGREMADGALLASGRAAPQRLRELGYEFRHATLEGALRAVL
jgi:uncharacterized protein (TIGR01777 family)